MIASLVHLQLGEQPVTEAIFGNHAFDRMQDKALRMTGADLGNALEPLAALPAGIGHVLLVRFLLAGDDDLFSVDDDDEVAGVEVWCENRLVLSSQDAGDLRRQAAEHGAIRVNDMPFPLVQIYSRQIGFHPGPILGAAKLAKSRGKSIGNSGGVGGSSKPEKMLDQNRTD